jgi:hypothetical protein
MDELSKIVDKIVDIVAASEGETILGVRLGAALKKHFPTFAPAVYQCRNLRVFVKTHVPKVVEKAYTGVDVIYTLAAAAPPEEGSGQSRAAAPPVSDPAPFISLPADPVTWKAYSNPSYPFAVIANRETGEIKATGEREVPQEPWISIPKLSPAVHYQIASDFVATLSGSAKTALTPILQDHHWYVSFFGTTKRLGVSQQWGLFKREHLIRHFTEALHQHGITAATSGPKHDLPPRSGFTARKPADPKRQSDDAQLRELVSRLAFALPIEELRSIRMPIGLVLDAFRQ